MRVKFSTTSGSLRVIDEIPHVTLAKLEGRNGIGKSLAARLLELVAGQPPYVGLPLAWSSLVEQLGIVRIHITDVGPHTIDVELDSRQWHTNDQIAAVSNPGQVRLDGVTSTWDQVRSVLQVRRIAGDETLSESIGLALFQTAKAVEVRRVQVSETAAEMSAIWDEFRLDVADPAGHASSLLSRLKMLSGIRHRLIQESGHAATLLSAAETTFTDLRLLRNIADALQLHASYEKAWLRRRDLATEIARAEDKLLKRRGSRAPGTNDEFKKLARLVRLRRDAHTRAQFDQDAVLRALNLDEQPDLTRVGQLLSDAQTQRLDLERSKKTLFAAGTIREAAGSLERTLLSLPSNLHHEAVAELDREVTVGELARGLGRRRESLRDVPKSDAVLTVERELRQNADRISLLESVGEVTRVAERKAGLLREVEADLEHFFAASESEQDERKAMIEDLAQKRDNFVHATSDALFALLSLRAAAGLETVSDNTNRLLRQNVNNESNDEEIEAGGADGTLDQRLVPPAELRAEIDGVISRSLESVRRQAVVMVDDRWPENLQSLIQECAEQREQAASAQQRVATELAENTHSEEETFALLRSLRRNSANFIDSLIAGGRWAELRNVSAAWLSKRQTSLSDLTLLLEDLRTRPDAPDLLPHEKSVLDLATELEVLADSLEEAASTVRDQWGLATAYITRESHELSPRLVHSDAQSWQFPQLDESGRGRTLKKWVEGEVGHLLSQDVLRRELFERATDVEYDLTSRSVVWRSEEGKRRRRPLEAFSSGEQVFAYTRAKLESLRTVKDEAEFVLIFLDEFGAFVARDRFGQLMQYVQTDVLGTIADQIVVMLPSGDTDAEFMARKATAEFVGDDYVVESLLRRFEAN